MNEEHGESGEPGKAGQEAEGQAGGKGGEGGRGGAGQPVGAGGRGGGGGQGAPGATGPAGPRGRLPHSIAVVYLVSSIVIAAVLMFMVFQIRDNRSRATEGQEAHDALCVFKADLARRAADGRRLLDDNADLKLIFGIPRTVIEQSVTAQESTLDSLRILDCQSLPERT
jgi:hypothetical protein